MMAVDESDVLLAASEDGESDWVLNSGSSLHMQDARDIYGWQTTQLAELLAKDQSSFA